MLRETSSFGVKLFKFVTKQWVFVIFGPLCVFAIIYSLVMGAAVHKGTVQGIRRTFK